MRRSIALAIAFACLIPATANGSLGKTTVGDSADQPGDGSQGSAQDWRAVASTSQTVNRLSVYLLGGTYGKPELALYDGSKTKLASCTIATVVTRAWNRCSIPDVPITAGSTYWLALLRPMRQGRVVFSNRSGRGASYGSLLSQLTATLPTWLNGVYYGRQKASFYADSATPPPPPPPDTTPPDTTITSQPADPTTATDASFAFTGTDDVGVTGYECQLDGGGWSPCSSPKDYSGLAVGTHSFDVRAHDAGGNTDPTPASYTWTVNAPSGGGGAGTEPGPIAGQGYHQVFRDDFNTLDRSVWDDHIWYDDPPDQAWTGYQAADADGILHLRTSRTFTGSFGNWPINTITTQSSGKTFQYGYFEVKMKWPAGHGSWPGFWLYSYKHATDASQCTTQAGEIDVMEGQGSEPTDWYGTVHSNTNGCSPADDQNANNYQETGTDLTADFHTYAVKWTPTTITWYLDGVQTHSAPAYQTDNQPMILLLQEWVGGWTLDPDSTTPETLDNQIDYVDVWQQ